MSKIVPISFHAVFQFHYGTIKRRLECTHAPRHGKFQFHYGTIKSFREKCERLGFNDFNSTMVRLKEIVYRD